MSRIKQTSALLRTEGTRILSYLGFDGALLVYFLFTFLDIKQLAIISRTTEFPASYFLLILVLIFTLGYFFVRNSARLRKTHRARAWQVVFVLAIFITLSTPMYARYLVYGEVSDSAIHTVAAMEKLLDGKNPYLVDYFGTRLEKLRPEIVVHNARLEKESIVNPALWHYVYFPASFLIPLPFFLMTLILGIGYTHLIFLWCMHIGTGLVGMSLVKQNKVTMLIAILLNPLSLPNTLLGANDIYAIFFLALAWALLHRRRPVWSGVLLAVSLSVKQYCIVFAPFFLIYILRKYSCKKALQSALAMGGVLLLVVGPFLLWDASAFVDDTIKYIAGTTQHSYPITGLSLGGSMLYNGFIDSYEAYVPFYLVQLFVTAPLVLWLLFLVYRTPGLHRVILYSTISLWVYASMGRFAHYTYYEALILIGIMWFIYYFDSLHLKGNAS
jgi:uncharacterized membrane protein